MSLWGFFNFLCSYWNDVFRGQYILGEALIYLRELATPLAVYLYSHDLSTTFFLRMLRILQYLFL